jgi:hypothetical protein
LFKFAQAGERTRNLFDFSFISLDLPPSHSSSPSYFTSFMSMTASTQGPVI